MIGGGAVIDAPAASSAFTPASLSPHSWWDPSDATTVTLNGSNVSQIDDKSGNDHHLTQVVAIDQPAYTAAGQNGLHVITFDGVTEFLEASTAADWTFLHDGTDYLIALVAKVTSATGGILGTTATVLKGAYIYKASEANLQHVVSTGAASSVENTAASSAGTSARIHTLLSDPNNGTAASRSSLFLNGGSAASNNASTTAVGSGAPAQALHIGNLTSTDFMAGFIGECVIVTGADANETNRALLLSYLNSKWAVY